MSSVPSNLPSSSPPPCWDSLAEDIALPDAANRKDNEAKKAECLSPNLEQEESRELIKQMFVDGCIYKEKAKPTFFEDLLVVMEQDWSRCKKVLVIYLTLDNTVAHTYFVQKVLNALIVRSQLQSLTLKHFGANLLLGSLATLSEMEQLDYLDVSDNELEIADFDFVLRLLPDDPIDKIDVDFQRNKISGECAVALLLDVANCNLKSVKLSLQSEPLNLVEIRKHLESNVILLER